jgi:hypothetical protein
MLTAKIAEVGDMPLNMELLYHFLGLSQLLLREKSLTLLY